jgi:hypothetical protein
VGLLLSPVTSEVAGSSPVHPASLNTCSERNEHTLTTTQISRCIFLVNSQMRPSYAYTGGQYRKYCTMPEDRRPVVGQIAKKPIHFM